LINIQGEVMNQDTPEALFETIGQYLVDEEWVLESQPDDLAYVGTFNGENIDWRILVSVDHDPELRRVSVDSFLPVKASLHIRPAVAEVIARINASLTIGKWDFDMDDGSLAYGVNVCLMDSTISQAMFGRMFGVNLAIVDNYANTILSVVYGAKTALEAFETYQASKQVETLQSAEVQKASASSQDTPTCLQLQPGDRLQ
jgi:hypothetical protein